MSRLISSMHRSWSSVSVYSNSLLELLLPGGVGGEGEAGLALPLGVELDEALGQVLHRLLGPALGLLPVGAPQPGELFGLLGVLARRRCTCSPGPAGWRGRRARRCRRRRSSHSPSPPRPPASSPCPRSGPRRGARGPPGRRGTGRRRSFSFCRLVAALGAGAFCPAAACPSVSTASRAAGYSMPADRPPTAMTVCPGPGRLVELEVHGRLVTFCSRSRAWRFRARCSLDTSTTVPKPARW